MNSNPEDRSDNSTLSWTSTVGVRLGAPIAALLLIVFATVYVGLSITERQRVMDAKERAVQDVVALFSQSVSPAVVFDDAMGVQQTLGALSHNPEVLHAAVYSTDDGVTIGGILGVYEIPNYIQASLTPSMTSTLQVSWADDRMGVASAIRGPEGDVIGLSWTEFSLADQNAAIADRLRQTLLTGLAITVITLFVILGVTQKRVSAPLGSLMRQVHALERGAAVVLENTQRDEVGNLARAFGAMAKTITAREAQIEQRNDDMRLVLDNVEQGFLTLDVAGRVVGERSATVSRWFGQAGTQTAVWHYLGGFDPRVTEWFELSWLAISDGVMPLELCLSQLPNRMDRDGRYFKMEYRPVVHHGDLEKVVAVISDISAEVARDRAELNNRQFLQMFAKMTADRQGFAGFMAETAGLIRTLVDGSGGDRTVALRTLHTLKGTTSMFGATGIATLCHAVETTLAQTNGLPQPNDIAPIEHAWRDLSAKLTPLLGTTSAGRDIDVLDADLSQVLCDLASGVPNEAIAASIRAWRDERAQGRLDQLADSARDIGARLNKKINIETYAGNIRLPAERWSPFWLVLGHCVRNAVDHGVEAPDVRIRTAKPPAGLLVLRLERAGDGTIVVSVSDDGSGIQWDAVRQQARERGLPHETHDDLVAAVFTDSVTTRTTVSDTSGRGVGLGALFATVQSMGGRASIDSIVGVGTTFTFTFAGVSPQDPAGHRSAVFNHSLGSRSIA